MGRCRWGVLPVGGEVQPAVGRWLYVGVVAARRPGLQAEALSPAHPAAVPACSGHAAVAIVHLRWRARTAQANLSLAVPGLEPFRHCATRCGSGPQVGRTRAALLSAWCGSAWAGRAGPHAGQPRVRCRGGSNCAGQECCQQQRQLGLHHGKHGSAVGLQQRHITDEVQHVAQALLGINQHARPCTGCRAGPRHHPAPAGKGRQGMRAASFQRWWYSAQPSSARQQQGEAPGPPAPGWKARLQLQGAAPVAASASSSRFRMQQRRADDAHRGTGARCQRLGTLRVPGQRAGVVFDRHSTPARSTCASMKPGSRSMASRYRHGVVSAPVCSRQSRGAAAWHGRGRRTGCRAAGTPATPGRTAAGSAADWPGGGAGLRRRADGPRRPARPRPPMRPRARGRRARPVRASMEAGWFLSAWP